MTSATPSLRQEQTPTIDGLAAGVEALRGQLRGNARLTSRELRALWGERLRPFWRLQIDLYRALSRRFLDLGENYLASEVAEEGAEFFGDDVALILTRALAIARSGAPQVAQEFLAAKEAVLAGAEESKSLLARTFKDLWKSSGEERYLREAFTLYHLDYTTAKGDRAFPGVNAASMARFLGRSDEATRIAAHVLELLREKPDTANYWDRVTIAECLLVQGKVNEARTAFAEATADGKTPHAHLATTRAQARLLLRHLGESEDALDACFPLPGVLVFSGHRVDAPGRAVPRFPEAFAPAIAERIRAVVAETHAGFGYAAAADGADILFLEALQAAGLETYVHLPLPEEEFLAQSVAAGWRERYRAVTQRATELTFARTAGELAFDYGNRLLLGAASAHARQLGSEVRLLTVWDRQPPAGAGGTADFVRLAEEAGCSVLVIELPGAPATRSAAAASDSAGDERLLSILAFSLPAEGAAAARVAAALEDSGVLHREVAAQQVRLFFDEPTAAARTALTLAPLVPGALGLHTGPLRSGRHALTGQPLFHGEHAAEADRLAALEPAAVYATREFAALLGLQPATGVRCELLGSRVLRPGGSREPLFQVRA